MYGSSEEIQGQQEDIDALRLQLESAKAILNRFLSWAEPKLDNTRIMLDLYNDTMAFVNDAELSGKAEEVAALMAEHSESSVEEILADPMLCGRVWMSTFVCGTLSIHEMDLLGASWDVLKEYHAKRNTKKANLPKNHND